MLHLLRAKNTFGSFLQNYSKVVNQEQIYHAKDFYAFQSSDQSGDIYKF